MELVSVTVSSTVTVGVTFCKASYIVPEVKTLSLPAVGILSNVSLSCLSANSDLVAKSAIAAVNSSLVTKFSISVLVA